MFGHRHRHRRPPFADFIDWNDYRWDASPWRGTVPPPLWGHQRQRGYTFWHFLLAGIAVVAGVKLVNSLRNGNGSWARKGLFVVLLLMIAGAFSGRSRRGYW